jgi:hypothetical protein
MRRRRQHLVNVKENTRSCPIFPTVYCLTRGAMGIIFYYHALINIPNHLAMLSPAGPAGHNYPYHTYESRLTSTMSPPFGYREPKTSDFN